MCDLSSITPIIDEIFVRIVNGKTTQFAFVVQYANEKF